MCIIIQRILKPGERPNIQMKQIATILPLNTHRPLEKQTYLAEFWALFAFAREAKFGRTEHFADVNTLSKTLL